MKNLNLKKLFICVFVLLSAATIFAQTTCSTIAEIKAQPDGTAIVFQGEAMTTYHQGELSGISYGVNGILMQDATGAILLKNAAFKSSGTMYNDPDYSGYRANYGGTKVHKIVGTFKKATSEYPDRIEFTNSELKKIETSTYGNPIPYVEVALSDLINNPAQYALLSILIKIDSVYKEGNSCYFKNQDNKIQMKPYFTVVNNSFPVAGAYYGFCESYRGVYRFSVEEKKYIYPSAVNTIVELYNFVDDSNHSIVESCEVEILEPVVVNYVEQEATKTNYYVQSSYLNQTRGLFFSVDKNYNLTFNVGDSIIGLKGYYSKYALNNNIHTPTTFTLTSNNLKVYNSGNVNIFKETKISTILGSPSEYESQLVTLPRGIVKKYTDKYYFHTYNSIQSKYDSICIMMGDATDLSSYLEKEVIVGGLFKIFADQPKIVIRSVKDIITDNLVFGTIGEMISAGRPISSSIICEILNPVLVTYKYVNTEKDMYGIYLQDETGAILYKTDKAIANVNSGDSIKGVKGLFQYETHNPGRQEHYLKGDISTELIVVNRNNNLVATPVFLDQVVNDPMQFASRLIKIENLETITRFGISQGTPYETEYIYQNGTTMNVVWNEMFENMTVIGVVEYGIMGYGLTIFPIEVKNTTKEFDGVCRRIKDIKNLAAGTEFTYVGDATTTYSDFENGILIQDYTGGILLRNAQLGVNGSSQVKSGMIMTNVIGKYLPATDNMIASIEISDVNLNDILIKDTDAGFTCRSTDINVIHNFYGKYLEGEALMLYSANLRRNGNNYEIVFAYNDGTDDIEVVLPAVTYEKIGLSNNTLKGYVRKFDGVLTFVIVDAEKKGGDLTGIDTSVVKHDVFMTINGELSAPEAIQLMVYDINGRILVVNESSQLNLSFLNRGVYLVHSIYVDGTTQITKIIR